MFCITNIQVIQNWVAIHNIHRELSKNITVFNQELPKDGEGFLMKGSGIADSDDLSAAKGSPLNCVHRESNPKLNLGRVSCYHYTMNAAREP